MEEEMRFHLEMQAEQNLASGMTAEEARDAARRRFGNQTWLREASREMWSLNSIETLIQDLRYGARMLWKNPGFTLIAVLTLGLGIGANTTIFSVVNATLLRPFPYREPERLVIIQDRFSGSAGASRSASYPNFVDWRAQNTVCSSMAAVRMNENFNFTGAGEPERLMGRIVSAEFLSTLGIQPMLGRDFLAEEDRRGATPAVILSYGFWQRRFGADPRVIGERITLNNERYTVVGITPPNFQYGLDADVTAPIGLSAERFRLRGADPGVEVVARLKPGVSPGQAGAELNLVAERLEQLYPEVNKGRREEVTPLHERFVGDTRQPLLILLGAVGLVLLIACANVANLLLVRSAARQKEMALRVALGADRGRVVRQLLTEALLLAAAGAALGILLALLGTRSIASQLPDGIPRLQEAQVDATTLGFTLAVSLLTALLFGLAPALQASRPDLNDGLKEGERGSSSRRQRLRGALVICEISLTLTLLVGAGLLIQSFWRALQVHPGFDARNLLTMQVSVNNPDGRQVANFFEQAQQKVRALPGVKSVAVSNGLPFGVANFPTFIVEGRPEQDQKPSGIRYMVSPDYFQTMGIELIRGRLFTGEDTRDKPPVVVVDETLARRFFPDEDPIGKRIKQSPTSPSLEIVGIVRHVENQSLDRQGQGPAQFYTNFNQVPLETLPASVRRINLLTRVQAAPLSLAQAVRSQVTAVNKDQAVFNVRSMEEIVAQSVAPRRFSMLLLSVFAVAALALASLGIYGMMSYTVIQRSREIGVRMALGARPASVLRLVIGQGMKLTFTGVAIGLAASAALSRTIKNLLFGVSANDPATFVALAALLTTVALLACWVPARRATKVDPMIALRAE
jgi:putative ABC transport system permease protein